MTLAVERDVKQQINLNLNLVDIPPQPVTNSPLSKRVQAIEATGANLDLTTGAKGVAIPANNDSQHLAGPPVRGRLNSFRREWLENCSNNILNLITNTYAHLFINKPILARQSPILSGYKDHQKDLALASCIQSLLTKKKQKCNVSWVLQSPASSSKAS